MKICPFCSKKVEPKDFITHLEKHEEESYQKEQTAFHETQKIRALIEKVKRQQK